MKDGENPERDLQREKEARMLAESLLEKKTHELNHLNEKLQLRNGVIESFLNAIVIINYNLSDYPIEYVNPAFEKMTGYTFSEAIGKNPLLLHKKDETDYETLKHIDTMKIAMKRGIPFDAVLKSYKKDGKEFWCDLHFYPVKDPDNEKITHYVGILSDVTENKFFQAQLECEQKLKYQATHDVLTGLANRTLLIELLANAIAQAKREHQHIAVMVIDLDGFKFVNDGFGHSSGDKLLEIEAKRLRDTLRTSDTLGRFGGDEFVVIAPHVKDILLLPELIKRLLAVIEEPIFIENQELHMTCSIGLSIYPNDGIDPEMLLKNADAAMYRAKEQGKNTYQFFTSEMHTKIAKRLTVEHGLRHALERNELTLYYQPKLDLKAKSIVGFEALIRWEHPERGLLMPDEFISIAEDSGLIIPIGEWVLRTACIQNKAWQDAGYPPIVVSVNLSPRQFKQKNFVGIVKTILEETNLKPEHLELELTESLIMSNAEEFINVLRALKDLGVLLSIDDFGTGYSSLSCLRRFPVNWLKIDRSFVSALGEGEDAASIIKAIISLGHSLNLRVLAEGVETQDQLNTLGEYNCDEIQGFYLSRPMPPDKVLSLLQGGFLTDK